LHRSLSSMHCDQLSKQRSQRLLKLNRWSTVTEKFGP
jgi:hypothetical protein